MVNFHFIKDQTTLSIIQAILDIAGPNFNAPYDAGGQPIIANNRNNEDLIQFQVPGGTQLKGYSEPSMTESMGSAINSMLAVLAPFISAYGLILPILGIIRGIIEVLCAMMNPFAVIKAVIRLFTKWLPPFISLYPPLAGVIIIISLIKTILAVVFFILTVVIPTIQLIIFNIKTLANAFSGDSNESQRQAGREKLKALVSELANQSGVMGALAPLMELIFLILGLVAGFPCKKGKSKGKKKRMDITKVSANFNALQEDATCCEEDVCPPAIRNPPSGNAVMVPTIFSEVPPFFAMKIITNNSKVKEYKQFVQNFPEQLNNQLDEEVDVATPAGGNGDTALIRVEITSRRGNARKINVPVVRIKGNDITVVSPAARRMIGKVSYKLKPNYDLMVMYGLIGLACHPDVEAVKEEVENKFPNLDESVLERFPDLTNLQNDFRNINSALNDLLNKLNNQIQGDGTVSAANPDGVLGVTNKNPPYDDNIQAITAIQDDAVARLSIFADGLKGLLNGILANATDKFNSTFDVDKTIVKADGKDRATLIVIPRDATGSNLAQNLPADVDVDVSFENNFGIILNKRRDNATGQILADIISTSTGTAILRAKVNSDFINVINDDGTESVKEIPVKFVSDAILPTRRFVTKPDQDTFSVSGASSEKEPKN